ncbi:FeoA family protein [Crassaminicella profunda]|uniref:FeoA family protein n=1 Tax=Crassaminicella profunda TaxID=1286698 RepID=UPI001FE844F0|nr:FeoA family protein [Crassaminicella profunda]
MASTLVGRMMNGIHEVEKVKGGLVRKLSEAKVDVEYTIKRIETDDEELKSFLFTLGCYEGEKLTVISILGENYVISVKDARYSMNLELAEAIII